MLTLNYGHGEDVEFDADGYHIDEDGNLVLTVGDEEVSHVIGWSQMIGAQVTLEDEVEGEFGDEEHEALLEAVIEAETAMDDAVDALLEYEAEHCAE